MIPTLRRWQRLVGTLALALPCAVLLTAAARPAPRSGPRCSDGATRLCLAGRFAVEASWRDAGGRQRAALALPLGTAGTGAFSFLDDGGADLLVRVVADADRGGFAVEAGAAGGAAFELRVVDVTTGEEWSHSRARGEAGAVRELVGGRSGGGDDAEVTFADDAGETADTTVADWLEAAAETGLAAAPVTASPVAGRACVASATDLCLLDGRLRVRVRSGSDDRAMRPARVLASRGETGIFAPAGADGGAVAIRLVDGRAANGRFWLLYDALTPAAVQIELTDLATGNRRHFAKAAGGPASLAEIEALSASAAVIAVTLDAERAVSKPLGPGGGFLEAIDARGARFRLVVPKGALITTQEVTVTPVASIGSLPFSGGLAGAVYIQPEGLVLDASALLTITPNPAVPRAQQLTFAFRGLAGELSLVPPRADQAALVVPVHRFGGYGLGAGPAADLAAQLTRLPSRPEDLFSQRLAGLILSQRRDSAGASPPASVTGPAVTASALPSGVLPMLRAEYTSGIRPRMIVIRQGNIQPSHARNRNWQNSVADTLQAAALRVELAALRSAYEAGARSSYNRAARSCNASSAATMYRAYSLLRALGRQGTVDVKKLTRCARFTFKFDTSLDSEPPMSFVEHEDVGVSILLTLNLAGGYFSSGAATPKVDNATEVTGPHCNVFFELKRTGTPTLAVMRVPRLWVSTFAWYEDDVVPLATTVQINYVIDPLDNQDWSITCTQHYPPAPQLGPITGVFHTTWAGIYAILHLQDRDLETGGLRATLLPAPGVFARKEYTGAGPILFMREETVLQLHFGNVP